MSTCLSFASIVLGLLDLDEATAAREAFEIGSGIRCCACNCLADSFLRGNGVLLLILMLLSIVSDSARLPYIILLPISASTGPIEARNILIPNYSTLSEIHE